MGAWIYENVMLYFQEVLSYVYRLAWLCLAFRQQTELQSVVLVSYNLRALLFHALIVNYCCWIHVKDGRVVEKPFYFLLFRISRRQVEVSSYLFPYKIDNRRIECEIIITRMLDSSLKWKEAHHYSCRQWHSRLRKVIRLGNLRYACRTDCTKSAVDGNLCVCTAKIP